MDFSQNENSINNNQNILNKKGTITSEYRRKVADDLFSSDLKDSGISMNINQNNLNNDKVQNNNFNNQNINQEGINVDNNNNIFLNDNFNVNSHLNQQNNNSNNINYTNDNLNNNQEAKLIDFSFTGKSSGVFSKKDEFI